MSDDALAIRDRATERALEVQEARIATLEELVDALGAYHPSDDHLGREERFAHLVSYAQMLLEIDDSDLARRLKVSRPTVGRWKRAETAPHPIGRSAVAKELALLAAAKRRSIRRLSAFAA